MAEHSLQHPKPLVYEWTPFYEVIPPKAPPTLRSKLEGEIDRLIEMLNALDGDCDHEPNGDNEPNLGWHEQYGQKADMDRARLTGGAS